MKEEEKEVFKKLRKEFNSDERIEIGEMYSQLLNKYRQTNGAQKNYNGNPDVRAEYV